METASRALTKRDRDRTILGLLFARYTKAFFLRREQRKPLKIGIFHDLAAELGGEVGRTPLRRALQYYTNSCGYLAALRECAGRINLDGEVAGCVSAEAAEHAKVTLAQITTTMPKRKSKKRARADIEVVKRPAPQRDDLAALREAAKRRLAQTPAFAKRA